MDDIMNYMNDVAYYMGIEISTLVLGVPFAYLSFLHGLDKLFPGKKLKSKEEVTESVREESKKLGLESEDIDIHFPSPNYSDDFIRIYEGKKAELFLSGPTTKSSLVRHELYHLKRVRDGHIKLDSLSSSLRLDYLLEEEPRAVLYGAFGYKLMPFR